MRRPDQPTSARNTGITIVAIAITTGVLTATAITVRAIAATVITRWHHGYYGRGPGVTFSFVGNR